MFNLWRTLHLFNTWPGLIIVLLGVPVYFVWRKKEVSE